MSDGGDVKEACLWHGSLATAGVARRATLLPSGATLTDAGMPAPDGRRGRPLAGRARRRRDPGRARRRGRRRGRTAGCSTPRSPTSPADAEPRTAYGRTFEVLDELPFARKRLRAALRERGYSDVVVKKRGVAVVPEELRRDLRLTGDGPTATLVLTRVATGPLALLVHPR